MALLTERQAGGACAAVRVEKAFAERVEGLGEVEYRRWLSKRAGEAQAAAEEAEGTGIWLHYLFW